MFGFASPFKYAFEYAREDGGVFRPKRARSRNVDSVDGLAIQIRRIALSQINGIRAKAKCTALRVYIIFVNDGDVNGFACAFRNDPHRHIVAVSRGALSTLQHIFYSAECTDAVRNLLPNFARRSDVEISRFLVASALWWLCYHELAHVFRGHQSFLNSKVKLRAFSSDTPARRRHLCEADADTVAGRMLACEMSRLADIFGNLDGGDASLFLKELAVLATLATHIVFRIFDQSHKDSIVNYPPPPIRSMIVSVQLQEQLSDIAPGTSSFADMLSGIGGAESLAEQLGILPGKYDFHSVVKAWIPTYMDDLARMSTILGDNSPCSKLNRRNEGKFEAFVNDMVEMIFYARF